MASLNVKITIIIAFLLRLLIPAFPPFFRSFNNIYQLPHRADLARPRIPSSPTWWWVCAPVRLRQVLRAAPNAWPSITRSSVSRRSSALTQSSLARASGCPVKQLAGERRRIRRVSNYQN